MTKSAVQTGIPFSAISAKKSIGAGLVERGHQVEVIADSYQDFGSGQFIWRLGDPAVEGYVAASDPRRDGQAAAY